MRRRARPQVREKDHIADAFGTGEHHDEAVDPDPDPAGRGHAVLEGAKKVLAQVNAGSVYWNCCDRVSPRLPWSGRGNSGLGFTLSAAGITAFTQPKAYHLRRP